MFLGFVMDPDDSVASETYSIGIVRDRTEELRNWADEPDGPVADIEMEGVTGNFDDIKQFASMVFCFVI